VSITPERWQQIDKLLEEALEREASTRAAFLDQACAGDDELRSKVEALLQSHEQAGSFIAAPALEVAAKACAKDRSQSMIGQHLGHYQILSLIGAGGMGEVYRARDTRLDRTVALKILPANVGMDQERMRRFVREAKAASGLNHPNIITIYEIDQSDNTYFIATEFIDGDTLRQRMASAPLKLGQALDVAIQVATALAAAHAAGIVHRDIKPENIMLRRDGLVKVLDFGLAKLTEHHTTSAIRSSTVVTRETEPGRVMGTPHYMSPEQARGLQIDARADLFSLGVVLHEMLTGIMPFEGATTADVIAAILHTEPPPLSSLQPMTPPALDRVVRTCLAKEPDERWQTARDLARELKWVAEGDSPAIKSAPAVTHRQSRERLAWIVITAVLFLAVLALATTYLRRTPAEVSATYLSLLPPEGTTFAPNSFASVSPDGRRVAFVATSGGASFLWVRPLDSPSAQVLPGTDGATAPFWSPDGRFIGFFAQRKLKRIEVSGESLLTLCDAAQGMGGAWSRGGVIVFAPHGHSVLYSVTAAGGTPTPLTVLDPSRRENGHTWPYFLPDGRRFVYHVNAFHQENRGINVGSLEGSGGQRLLRADSNATYAPPGYLVFVRGGTLLAQPFDAERLKITDAPLPVTDQVRYDRIDQHAPFSVSENGMLTYEIGGNTNSQLVWFDRGGRRLEPLGERDRYLHPELSPEGKRVAVEIRDPRTRKSDLWLFDLARGVRTRFTSSPGSNVLPHWSPDGNRIVFAVSREEGGILFQKSLDGAVSEELPLKPSASGLTPTDWSPDGRFILYQQYNRDPKAGIDLWVLPLFADRQPKLFLKSKFGAPQGRFSPDGQWMAYASAESGKEEMYVQRFPATGDKVRISAGGGTHPRWRRDGKELFYFAPDRRIMAVVVKTGDTFEAGKPQVLFEARDAVVYYSRYPYAVTPDGQRFLINTSVGEAVDAPITVVLNWTAGLRR
jgi:serine/threonine protein kinase